LLLSLICLQKHLDSGRIGWLVGSLLLFAFSLVTYEISYVFPPVFLAVIYARCRHWKPAIAAVHPYVLTAAMMACYVAGLRYPVHLKDDNPYKPNLEPAAVVQTTLRQASAALPVSYALLSEHRDGYFSARRVVGRWDNWAIGIAAGAITLALLRRTGKNQTAPTSPRVAQEPQLGLLLAVGLLLFVLPGVPIALSPKYQTIVKLGLGYLPVYLQYFGTALLGVAGLLWLMRTFPRRKSLWGTSLLLANLSVALITFDTNRNVVDTFNADAYLCQRRILEAAFQAGLCDRIPEGATLMLTKFHPWLCDGPPQSSGYFTHQLKRKVNALNGQPIPGLRTLRQQLVGEIPAPTFAITDFNQDPGTGYVILSSVDGSIEAPADPRFGATHFQIFLQGEFAALAGRPNNAAVVGRPLNLQGLALSAQTPPATASDDWAKTPDRGKAALAHLKLTRSGKGWALYEGSFPVSVDVTTVELRVNCPPAEPLAGATGRQMASADSPEREISEDP
jgi:hypothetical protein